MHIVIASDTNYAEFVAVVIVSAIANNTDYIHFHLLSNAINDSTVDKLKSHIPVGKGELHVYDIQDIEERLQIHVPATIAICAYARLFLPSILPADVEKVLYVDCDTVICDDLSGLWNTDLEGKYVAGILDTLPNNESKVKVGMCADEAYINSGVLLINLELWRKDNIQQQFIDFLLEYNGNVHHHDQGLINGVCKGRMCIVHPRYNCTSNYYSHPYNLLRRTNTPFYSEQECMDATTHPAILHFTEGFYNRPWIVNSQHPMASVFHHYHDMTTWRNTPQRKDKRTWLVRFLSWEFLHLPYPMYDTTTKMVTKLAATIKRS